MSCTYTDWRRYFTGLIDEVKVYGRALAHEEVLEIFRSTMHNGGHCENNAEHSHCDTATTYDYCDAVEASQIHDLGAAHGTIGQAANENSDIGTRNQVCNTNALLVADGLTTGLARESPTFGVWGGHAVTSCVEVDFAREVTSDGIKFAAASSDEQVCADDSFSCAGAYCGTGGHFLVFVSGAQRAGPTDYTTFHYAGVANIPVDTGGTGNNIDGQMLFDELAFENGEAYTQVIYRFFSFPGTPLRHVLNISGVAFTASGSVRGTLSLRCWQRARQRRR